MSSTKPDHVLAFLNTVTPRLGPANAINLLKDAHIVAFRELFETAGVPKQKVDETIERHIQQMAQNVLKTPTPSPFSKL